MVHYGLILHVKDFFKSLIEIIEERPKPVKTINGLIEDADNLLVEKWLDGGYVRADTYSQSFETEEDFRKFNTDYFLNLEFALITPFEELYFKNKEKPFFHATPLFNIKSILECGKIWGTDREGKDFNAVFLSEDFAYATLRALRYLKDNKLCSNGLCIIVPNTNNRNLYKKTIILNDEGEDECYYSSKLNHDYSLSKEDEEFILKRKRVNDNCNDIFTKGDILVEDIKRIYIVNFQQKM